MMNWNNNIYTITATNNNNNESKIYKINNDDTKTLLSLSGIIHGSHNMGIFGNYIYATSDSNNDDFIIQIDTTNNNSVTTWINISNPSNLVISNNYMYVSSITNNTISQINMTTKNITIMSNDDLSAPYGLVVNNGNLFVTNIGNGNILSIPIPFIPIPNPNSNTPCFLHNSKILTRKGYIPIQDLRNGDLVKTSLNGFKPIFMIGKRDINHPCSKERIKTQLYKCTEEKYPEIFEDLIITGCHCILVDDFVNDEQRYKAKEVHKGRTFVTDKKYRLPACADEKASVYEIPGDYTIYHLALENDDYFMNYGIYANGLLVESCSKRYLKEKSNMILIE